MKSLVIPIVGIVLTVGLVVWWWQSGEQSMDVDIEPTFSNEEVLGASEGAELTEVDAGTYVVRPEESIVRWAGQKPLISGYVNSGSIAVSSGSVEVAGDGAVSGSFVIDMQTLSVSGTPTKPGQESLLESHLRGDRWFDVDTHTTAEFTIIEAIAAPTTVSSRTHDIRGTLTMKGETNEVTFPATVLVNEGGVLTAQASFEIDRTLWGITAGSGSFFDNLADNMIDDMVAISFTLVAER